MTLLTGREILQLAIRRAGGNAAELGRAIRIRDFTNADGPGAQIRRWARPDGPKIPSDVVLRALDYMGAINWEALTGPVNSGNARKAER